MPLFSKCAGDYFITRVSSEGGQSPRSQSRTQRSHHTGSGWRAAGGSDGEGDEAVVTLDVPLEDLGAGPQHALEAGPVQLHALEGAPGHHSGRPGPVQEQCNLPWGRERVTSGAWPGGRAVRFGKNHQNLRTLSYFRIQSTRTGPTPAPPHREFGALGTDCVPAV